MTARPMRCLFCGSRLHPTTHCPKTWNGQARGSIVTTKRIDPGEDFAGALAQITESVVEDIRAFLPGSLSPLERARRRLALAGRHYEWAVRNDVPYLTERARQLLDLRAVEYVRLLDEGHNHER